MQETCSTLTVTGLCLPISMHGFVERGEQPTCADEQYLRVGVSLFDSKRGEVVKYSANYQCVEVYIEYCTFVPQLYLIVYAVSEIFLKKVCTLSSIIPFSNFFA